MTRTLLHAAVLIPLLAAPPVSAQADLGHHFDAWRAAGTFVGFEPGTGTWTIHDSVRAETRFLPASTFKIFNSLLALDLGVVAVDDTIRWDGVRHPFESWNQDQRMREAFQRSVVWYYQELARRIGQERMAAALARESYGNASTAGGIDQFWLRGELAISAREQVEFLERLHTRRLAFGGAAVAQVEDLLVLERCDNYVLRGKTGWRFEPSPQLGWLVGWVERAGEPYYFAMNLESADRDFPMMEARPSIVRGILRELGVLPERCTRADGGGK